MSPEFAVPASWWFFFFFKQCKIKTATEKFFKVAFFLRKKIKIKTYCLSPKRSSFEGQGLLAPLGAPGNADLCSLVGAGRPALPAGPQIPAPPPRVPGRLFTLTG